MFDAEAERQEVLRIMAETKGNPAERERRLRTLANEHAICPGVVCRCDEIGVKCPRRGTRRVSTHYAAMLRGERRFLSRPQQTTGVRAMKLTDKLVESFKEDAETLRRCANLLDHIASGSTSSARTVLCCTTCDWLSVRFGVVLTKEQADYLATAALKDEE